MYFVCCIVLPICMWKLENKFSKKSIRHHSHRLRESRQFPSQNRQSPCSICLVLSVCTCCGVCCWEFLVPFCSSVWTWPGSSVRTLIQHQHCSKASQAMAEQRRQVLWTFGLHCCLCNWALQPKMPLPGYLPCLWVVCNSLTLCFKSCKITRVELQHWDWCELWFSLWQNDGRSEHSHRFPYLDVGWKSLLNSFASFNQEVTAPALHVSLSCALHSCPIQCHHECDPIIDCTHR